VAPAVFGESRLGPAIARKMREVIAAGSWPSARETVCKSTAVASSNVPTLRDQMSDGDRGNARAEASCVRRNDLLGDRNGQLGRVGPVEGFAGGGAAIDRRHALGPEADAEDSR
jgi:hypothetical protein